METPRNINDTPPSIFADEVDDAQALDDDREEDEDGEDGKSGESGGRKPKIEEKVKIDRRFIDDYLADEHEEASWLDKLKSLALLPFSLIMPGTTAMAAENDLARKMMLGRFGLFNRQIVPSDLADPDLIDKLEKRFQERRERIQRELGIAISPSLFAPIASEGKGASSKGDKTPKTKMAKAKSTKSISFAEKEMRDTYGLGDKKSEIPLTAATSFALSGDEETLRKINDPNQIGVTTVTPELDLTDLMSDFDDQDDGPSVAKANYSDRPSFTERFSELKEKIIDALSTKHDSNILMEEFSDASEGARAEPVQIQVLEKALEFKSDATLTVTPSPLKPFGS